MAIADIVQYETPVALKVLHPISKEPIGVTFEVRHIDCDAALAAGREHDAQNLLGHLSDNPKQSDRDLHALVACVTGWDWDGQEFEKEKGVLDFTPENVLHVLSTAKWIRLQVNRKAATLANFTGASGKV